PWQLLARHGCTDDGVCQLQRLVSSSDLSIPPGEGYPLGELELDGNGEIRGNVTLPESDPNRLAGGISVFVPGSPFRTSTATDGSFRLANIPRGRVLVEFFYPGYEPLHSGR